jgi:NAD(P)-dependent dehydrogenase (short-subunit alcohol dehydrogenase family)
MNKYLDRKNILITGGLGLLGLEFAKAIISAGGTPVIFDVYGEQIAQDILHRRSIKKYRYLEVDITDAKNIEDAKEKILNSKYNLHGIVNNAALNPKFDETFEETGFESFCVERWNKELSVGLTGAILVTKIITPIMLNKNYLPSIVNISSDLGVIAPDHRIYNEGNEIIRRKPVSYSIIKHGIIGLTKYTATHWGECVRCNSLVPGGVYNGQDIDFVNKVKSRVPLKRMAERHDYNEALIFLLSDASNYMTGQQLIIDGGRSVW